VKRIRETNRFEHPTTPIENRSAMKATRTVEVHTLMLSSERIRQLAGETPGS
jgi:hypothetical protein